LVFFLAAGSSPIVCWGFWLGGIGSLGDALPYSLLFLALTQVALGGILIAQAFYNGAHKQCPGKRMLFGTRKTVFTAGMLTGVTLCPPLLLAISLAMENGSPWRGVLFFVIFFWLPPSMSSLCP